MRFSSGVPAWLGAVRVFVVLGVIPALVATVACWAARQRLGWSGSTLLLTFYGTFLGVLIGQILLAVRRTRRPIPKPSLIKK